MSVGKFCAVLITVSVVSLSIVGVTAGVIYIDGVRKQDAWDRWDRGQATPEEKEMMRSPGRFSRYYNEYLDKQIAELTAKESD